MTDAPPPPNQPADYAPPAVWTWDKENGGRFANINRPIAGATHDKDLPVGRHPFQLYSLATPNGQKVTIMFEELLAAAECVMHTAHAPYSNFPVGVALRGGDGQIYAGSNVENASYPQGQCAETSAIGVLVGAGQTEITEVAVVAGRMDFCPPCGGCRQLLAEFASPDTPVHLGRPGGPRPSTRGRRR